jgi:midasin
LKILTQAAVPGPVLVQGMCRAHIDVRILTEVTHSGLPVSLRELYEWVSLLQQLLERGGSLSWSLTCSWEQVYARRLDTAEARQEAMEKFQSRLGSVNLLNAGNWNQVACSIPGGWPSPLTFAEYCIASKEAMVLRDSAFVEYLGAQSFAFKSLREWPLMEDGQSELLKRLEGTRTITPHLPASLLHYLLNPEQGPTTDNPAPNAKTQDLDLALLFASLWMLEQGSYVDINLRIQWLGQLTGCLQGFLHSVKRVVAAIKRETAHPLSRELSSMWEKYSQERDINTVSSLVERSATLSNLESKGNLGELIFMATRLQILRRSLLQWEEEDEQYRMIEQLGSSSSSGPIVQSYWQHNHRAERSRLPSGQYPRAMLIYLYPLFSALRELENRVLVSCSSGSWESVVGPFLNVQEWHEALWKHLSRTKFDVEGFLFHWSSLKRSLQALSSTTSRISESVVEAEDVVKGLIKLIDEPFSLGENPLAKPLLWKYAGHPGLPHSREVFDLEVKVMKICEDLWQSGGNEEIITISTDGDIRRLTTTGLSIIRWLDQDAVGEAEESTNTIEHIISDDGATASTSYSESLAIYQLLKGRVEHEKAELTPLGDHDIIPLPSSSASITKSARSELKRALCVSFPKELLRWPSAWALWAELLPWLSNISICQDTRLIAEVSLLAGTEYGTEESLLAMLKDRVSMDVLKKMIEFAISCSSRSPADLVPHQHLLWLLDGTHPTKSGILPAFREVSHELVYRWHSALWTNMLAVSNALEEWGRTMGPARIFYAAQTVHFATLLGRTGAVRDHYAKLTQLRLASVHVWTQAKLKASDVFASSMCSASAIFQQIICSHGKSFHEDDYRKLVSILSVLHSAAVENKSELSMNGSEILGSLTALLKRSQHAEFLKLVEPLVLPCMKLLYSTLWNDLSFSDCLLNLGRVWLYLGELRLHLLLPSDGCDPVAKYSHKHAHLISRSTLLDLEIKVRQESEFLVRGSRHSAKTQNLLLKLEGTKQDLTSLALKLVPRPDPPQFRNFLSEVLQFMKSSVDKGRLSVLASELMVDEGRGARTLHEVSTWQENAMQFINRLVLEFPAYRDVVQPVLLAVYELKFGLSLLQAGHVQRGLFDNNDVSTGERGFGELLCTLMQFPTVRSDVGHKISASCTELVTNTTEAIISKVANSLLSGPIHKEVLDLELKVMVMRVAILRCGIDTQQARVKAKDVVKAVNNIFATLASLWSEIRERQMARDKEEEEFIRFTARTHTMETEDEIEEASFREMFVDFKAEFPGYDDDDTGMLTAEMDDRRAEAALKEKEKAADDAKQRSDKAWLKIQEPLIQDVVTVHRHMFSRKPTILNTERGAENALVSDWERENAFSLAYQTGVRLLGAIGHRVSAKVDDSLMESHMMQVGVEHRRVGDLRHSSETRNTKHNIYKDPNPPEMALMLEPLRQFLERVSGLLAEWPDHPILVQFSSIAKALVGISLEAPIMKPLTGIELLLSKAQLWEENSAKHVSLAREMGELMKLVRRWRKLELESWPALLECTLEKHEKSAEKLWFFLHGLLHRQLGEDFSKEMEATISSLEEFMQTSPLGEFQRRLDLLSSFYGQFLLEEIYDDPHAGASRTAVQKLCNVLYNVREYYSQFLPAVEEALTIGKAPIEKELKGFVKLTKWEDRGYYALAVSAEKTHRKLHKLIRKYDDLLKKSAMEVLSKQSLRMGAQTLATLTNSLEPSQTDEELTEKPVDNDDKPVAAPMPVEEVSASRGSSVITAWDQFCGVKVAEVNLMVSGADQGLPELHKRLPSLTAKMGTLLGVGVFAPDNRKMEEDCVNTLEELSTAVIQRSAELRKGEKRLAVKKKALIDLLRALRDIGLSHHKSAVPKDERSVNNWFQQPGSNSAEMLMLWAHQEVEVVAGLSSIVSIANICSVWTRAKTYYFQNVALLQRLGQSALDFNKALSLREVEVSSKYMEHLLFLQRKQRHTAFEFSSKLSGLVHLTSLLSGMLFTLYLFCVATELLLGVV